MLSLSLLFYQSKDELRAKSFTDLSETFCNILFFFVFVFTAIVNFAVATGLLSFTNVSSFELFDPLV